MEDLIKGELDWHNKVNENFHEVDSQMAEQMKQLNKPRTIEQIIERMLNKEDVTIVCYGDSITWGYTPNTGVQTATPYPVYLQKLLREYYGYDNITVINLGNSGKQSDEFASDNYVNNVRSQNPDMIIFMCGINDCTGGTSGGDVVPVENYKENISTMVLKLDYPFIFMTPTFFSNGTENQKSRFVQYVNAMREMSKILNIKLIDLYSIILKDLEKRNVTFDSVSADGTHYSDDYYKKIAEFVFSFGLCCNDIVIKDEKFINPLSNLFRWSSEISKYYTSDINPIHRNIYLRNDDSKFSKLSLYLFADDNNLDLQTIYIPNYGTSPNNTVIVNGVSYDTPIPSPLQTIFKLRIKAIPLQYGLNTIVYNTSNSTPERLFNLIYGVNIIKHVNRIVGTVKPFVGNINIQADTADIQKTTKILTLKDNNFTSMTIKFSPSAPNSGIAFGTGTVKEGETISEYPLVVVLSNGIHAKLYDLRKNDDLSLYNTDGHLNFSSLFEGSMNFNMNEQNILKVTIVNETYIFTLNGSDLFTLPKTTLNLGVLDVWGYSIDTNQCTIDEISLT